MTLTVEVALDLAANGQGDFFTLDDPVKGELDNATYLLAGDVFVDFTDRVRSLRISRGRSSRLARFTSATGQVVFDNRDRALDPSYAPGASYDDASVDYDDTDHSYDSEGSPYYGLIVPRKQVRIRDGDTLIALVQVEDWGMDFSLSGDMLAVASLTDGLASLAQTTIDATAVSAELSGARVAAILDAAGWPDGMRTLDAGKATLAAGTADAGNALTYLQKVESSDPGALFVGKDATLTFLDRATLQTYDSGIVFGDDGIPFTEPYTVTYGTDDMVNRQTITYSGGTATSDNASSQAMYGVIAQPTIDTLIESGVDAALMADWIVERGGSPSLRIKVITVKRGACSDAQWAQVLSLELGSTALVKWQPGGVGDVFSQYVKVDGIAHDITAGSTVWTVTLTLSETSAGLILDDPVFGVLDSGVLAF